MRCEKLKKEIETTITTQLLTPENCTMFYLEGIRFKNDTISKACEEAMVVNFDAIS